MRITDLLSQNAVCLGASVSGREEALDRLIALQGKAGNLNDAARYRADLLAREKLGSTAIGNGIAVPHAKSGAVLRSVITDKHVTVSDNVTLMGREHYPIVIAKGSTV